MFFYTDYLTLLCFRMLISSVLFLAVWTSSSFAEESSSSDAASAKRAPMGFQGMRGKKDLISMVAEHNELPKRTLVDFQVIYFNFSIKSDVKKKKI